MKPSKSKFNRFWLLGLAVGLGAAAGYLYYYFIGCRTGTCYITSNPWRSTLYGAVLGALLGWPSGSKEKEADKNDAKPS